MRPAWQPAVTPGGGRPGVTNRAAAPAQEQRQSGRTSMAVSIEQARRDRPAPDIAPVPTAGNGVGLKFEIQPAANPTSEKERTARLVDPGFGRVFTDHMAIVRYNQAKGWHDAR